jgi:hypothetical protein
VIGAAFLRGRRVAVLGEDYPRVNAEGALDGLVEIIDFEPEKDAVAVGTVVGISDRSVVMLGLEAVKLKDEISVV